MSEVDEVYDLEVLKMVVNKYLNETLYPTEESLRKLEANRDQTVWELATKIYTQSEHKVQFSMVRDVVDSRIRDMKHELQELAAEKERIAAEEARRIAEKEARHASEIERFRDQVNHVLGKFGGDESKAMVFVRVRKVISKELEVDESEVSLDSHLSNDLGADAESGDLSDLVMALEEEFNIEISDSEIQDELDIYYSSYSGYSSSSSQSFWSMLGSISAISSSSYSSSGSTGDNCIVKSFVDLIYNKVSD